MNFNLSEDLSKLTTIPEWQFQKLTQLSQEDICQCITDSISDGDGVCRVDIGIGTLIIGIDGDSVQYKFIPCKQFEQMVVDSVNGDREFLKENIEISTNMRMLRIYKELL